MICAFINVPLYAQDKQSFGRLGSIYSIHNYSNSKKLGCKISNDGSVHKRYREKIQHLSQNTGRDKNQCLCQYSGALHDLLSQLYLLHKSVYSTSDCESIDKNLESCLTVDLCVVFGACLKLATSARFLVSYTPKTSFSASLQLVFKY